jgi:diacylglycerol kinase family enzyme
LNGLLGRDDLEEAIQLPIGIIPAGSENSLVWTVLGIRDPVSAATTLAKGGITPIDVFSVKRTQAGITHFGLTASYYGFVADGKSSFFCTTAHVILEVIHLNLIPSFYFR